MLKGRNGFPQTQHKVGNSKIRDFLKSLLWNALEQEK
jgi:hypothetical protein